MSEPAVKQGRRLGITRPYAHLNLRINPFGEPTRAQWAGLAVGDPPPVGRGEVRQILGHCGRGKTTYLLALAQRMANARYLRVDPPPARPPPLPRGKRTVLLLDEAQALSPRRMKKALRRFETIVFTSHLDLAGMCRRPVSTVCLAGLSVEKLETIIAQRLEWARRGPGPLPRVSRAAVLKLIRCHGDDVRAILDHLYDVFQCLKKVCDVEV